MSSQQEPLRRPLRQVSATALSVTLVAVGCCALALALLLPLFVYPRLAVLPDEPAWFQDLRTTDATALVPDLDSPTGTRVVKGVAVSIATSITQSPEPSRPGSVVWRLATTTTVAGHGVVDARYEDISLDRRTALPDNCCADTLYTVYEDDRGAKLRHVGYLNFPFDTQKQDYPLWDVQLRTSRTAVYSGQERRDGFDAYKFVADTPLTRIGYRELPGGLFDVEAPSVQAIEEYADRRTYWVEPSTGSVVGLEDTLRQQFTYAGRTVVAMDAELTSPPLTETRREQTATGARVLPWFRERATLPLIALGALLIFAGQRTRPRTQLRKRLRAELETGFGSGLGTGLRGRRRSTADVP